jgi:hypothetical protein
MINLQIWCYLNSNLNFYGKGDSQIHMQIKKPKNSQNNLKKNVGKFTLSNIKAFLLFCFFETESSSVD